MNYMYKSYKDVKPENWPYKYFSPKEIACKGTGTLLINHDALSKLDKLRKALGKPMVLTSAYRSESHNRKVGGAKFSWHMKGRAFDVRMENHDPHEFEKMARTCGFKGIGYYPEHGFMHIDDRDVETTWGTPFKNTATTLPYEPGKQPSHSTTLGASAGGIATTVAGGAQAVAKLDGTAQIIAVVACVIVVVAFMWIARERLKNIRLD